MNGLVGPMVPEPTRVLDARKESSDVVTLTLDSGPAGARAFRPGQFNMLYAFGVGEVPISMSGAPGRSDIAVHTIKAVGAVTEALCRLQQGGTVGVRGPYGTPWPMEDVSGSDLLIVAGGLGLAPLRPVVYQALAQRSAYGRCFLLVGARTPEDLLFREELEAWQQRDDITVLVTVDRAATGWKGRVGVVPALLSEVELAPAETVAFVCGPEVMMRFSVRELSRRGISDERIYLSMERNMKCAVGFCGHCQYGPSFICKDGPVLRYDRIRSRFWLREI
jgi:NAD(P)H-flavin reductase